MRMKEVAKVGGATVDRTIVGGVTCRKVTLIDILGHVNTYCISHQII